MTKSIIDQFARGNQELFHSAFIAWLLDANGSHGLGPRFLEQFKALLPPGLGRHLTASSRVSTEYPSGKSRFDIFLEPPNPGNVDSTKGLVVENKVKSFGNAVQLDAYVAQGFDVLVLAFLPQTLDEAAKRRYPVVTYASIRDILQQLPLDASNHFHFLIREYRDFLMRELEVYETIRMYCSGQMTIPEFKQELKARPRDAHRDNDIRTYSYFYYHQLNEHIVQVAPDLAGTTNPCHEEGLEATTGRWFFEKNMQGPPFMEANFDCSTDTGPWKLHSAIASVDPSVQIVPRIEVWLNLIEISSSVDADPIVGDLKLGTPNQNVKQILRSVEPYRSTLTMKRGKRNFHCESLSVSDLQFKTMVSRVRSALRLVCDFQPC